MIVFKSSSRLKCSACQSRGKKVVERLARFDKAKAKVEKGGYSVNLSSAILAYTVPAHYFRTMPHSSAMLQPNLSKTDTRIETLILD